MMTFRTVGNVLFVGTGGGNDVFSTLFAIAEISRDNRWGKADIAGVLSPFHGHSVEPTDINGVFRTTCDSKRFLPGGSSPKEIGFVDSHVSRLIAAERPYGVGSVYGLSLRNGSVGLSQSFAELARIYETIVLVDIGGDIFYRGKDDPHVLSPMFDAMVLRAFVDSGASGFLFEAGPGTDGELEPQSLRRSFAEVGAESHTLSRDSLDMVERYFKSWIEPVRPGRTVPITIEACRSREDVIRMPYRARAHLGAMRRYAYFDQVIDVGLCRQFHLVDPSRISNPFAVSCRDPFDWFVQTQVRQRHTNSEANLEHWECEDGLWQFVTPSPLFPQAERIELIEAALDGASAPDERHGCWMLPADWESVRERWADGFGSEFRNGLVCLRRFE